MVGVQSHLKAVVLRETWLLHKNKDGWGGGVSLVEIIGQSGVEDAQCQSKL